ncbi:GGDEF domain-containing protein [Mycolicibacterium baixiangningiae]|uniref:GGDEF domain-containing protein n=1 Tax=Mycolicibacterium baixiangningiae TaxID=2761578 RepID=UPI001E4BC21A|nr:GGDEF domain-containing protein [Mycolicibacterium baixiangningiae]
MTSRMEWVRRWWQLPDHFEWLTGYLFSRGMMAAARIMLALMVASLALVPIMLVFSSFGPRSTIGVAVSWFAGFAGWATMVPYVQRWPSRTQSLTVSFVATACIAAVSLAQSDPLVELVACFGFVTPAAYVAFLHTSRYTAYVFAVAVVTAAIGAVRLASAGQLVGATALFWFVVVLNAVIPFGVQTIVHALGVDVVRSEWDPLTGLLTRRAFYQRLVGLVADNGSADRNLLVAVIDLDRFKNLNDTHGHAAGDRALIAVGRALSRSADDDALVGRIGGEEFVVATISPSANPTQLAMRLRAAIEKAATPLTASVGTASVPLVRLRVTGWRAGIDEAITTADTAMYAAKRAGGNQVRHSQLPMVLDDDPA